MVPERVPGELAGESVILVEVVTRMGEDDLRIDAELQLFEDVLHLAAAIGQESIAKVVNVDPEFGHGLAEERVGARPRFGLALVPRGEDEPVDLELGVRNARARAESPRNRSRCRPRDSR